MWIVNVKVYSPEHKFIDAAVEIKEGKISAVDEKNTAHTGDVVDGSGNYMIPGMIDMHFHGCVGHDVCDGTTEAWEKIAEFEVSKGVTAICPATMTLPQQELLHILEVGAKFAKEPHQGSDVIGINMEGPFISKAKKGAQKEDYILPCNLGLAESFLKASEGLVKVIGVAPEASAYEKFIMELKEHVHLSLAHTNAGYQEAQGAFECGADHVVHLYNAMPLMHHRDPGVAGAAADHPNVTVELIGDGIHVHPSMIRSTFRMFGSDRIILISDSMRAAGLGDGLYTLGGQYVAVKGRCAKLATQGSLAGSVTPLNECLKNVVQMGIPLEEAVPCVTENPARKLGVFEERGSIEVGKIADVVFLDEHLDLVRVMKDGEIVSSKA